MWTPFLAVLVAAAPAFAGEPLLVPDFTPGTTSEFSLAFMLQEAVNTALTEDGHVVLTSDRVAAKVGGLDACADTEGCPYDALQRLPARLAVVVRVERREGTVVAEVELFDNTAPTPMDTRTVRVDSGREAGFAGMVVAMVDAAIEDLGPGPAGNLSAARALLASAPAPVATTPKPVPTKVVPPPVVETPVETPTPPGGTVAERLAKADLEPRHIVGVKKSFETTELTPLAWLYSKTPHSGRLIVEIRGGLGIGDTDRHADLRVALENTDDGLVQVADWYQEGPQVNRRLRGELYVGYAPTAALDIGAQLGLQYGHRSVSTGFTIDGEQNVQPQSDEVQAVQFAIKPIVRVYPVAIGIAKPFLYAGADLRIFDNYKIEPAENLVFPEPIGGLIPGVIGGGGIMIDPGPIVGFFLEGSYTRHFGVRAGPAGQGTPIGNTPTAPDGDHQTIGVTAGVQFRL